MVNEGVQSGVDAVARPGRGEIDEIGLAIKARRAERGWSLRKLAGEAGVSASLLSAVETGKIVPTVSSLFAVSDALGLPAQELFPPGRRPVELPTTSPTDADVAGETSSVPSPGATMPEDATGSPAPAPRPTLHDDPAAVPGAERDPAAAQRGSARPVRDGTIARPTHPRRRVGLRGAHGRAGIQRAPDSPAQDASPSRDVPAGRATHPPGDLPPVDTPTTVNREDRPSPGVIIVRAGDRLVMQMENGTTWSLVMGTAADPSPTIEVSIPRGVQPPSLYRTHGDPVSLVILSGRLTLEGGFARHELAEGDSVTVGGGVPHRFGTDAESPCRFLWTIAGQWDGRI